MTLVHPLQTEGSAVSIHEQAHKYLPLARWPLLREKPLPARVHLLIEQSSVSALNITEKTPQNVGNMNEEISTPALFS